VVQGRMPSLSISNPKSMITTHFPFFSMLNLSNLTHLMNGPITHHPDWPPIPTNSPSDIPKFEGKSKEDPLNHEITFHLWCSSNSLMENRMCLHLFQ
jgi:hypothetical protein